MTELDIKKPLIPAMPQCVTSFLPARLNQGLCWELASAQAPRLHLHRVRTAGERNTPLSDRAPWAPICPLSEAFLPCSPPWYLFADLSDRCSHCSESHPPHGVGVGGCHSDPLPWLTASWAPLPALFHPCRGDGRGSPGHPLAFIPPRSSAPAAAAHSI